MKKSIRKQLVIIFVSLMTMMFLISFLANTFFLKDFYFLQKEEVLMDAYHTLNDNITREGVLSQDKIDQLDDICTRNSISFVVTDQNYKMLVWTTGGYQSSDLQKIMLGRLNGYGIGLDQDETDVLKRGPNYTIQKKYDGVVGINYLEMWGILEKGYYFIMRVNAENISEGVRISNEFLGYSCLICVLISAVLVWYFSRRVARPIGELTDLSKRMADLDFDVRYTSGGTDEIGQLGDSFNRMSEKLEQTYADLLSANNELQKDIEQKQKIDQMRTEFLSNVSHELKTPLALIQGYAEGLEECINDDEESRRFYLEVIQDEAIKMNSLVQKLLTLNQLEFGNEQVSMDRFDLAETIRNKIQSMKILAEQQGVSLVYEGPDHLPVWADEFKVEEVLTNYLSNAFHHVDGEHKIVVFARIVQENQRVRVSVFNTGQQIPDPDLEHVWEKFYKVDKARTREYGGSGVGLSIVKAIMDSFHEQYGVENVENGVKFWFELRDGSNTGNY